MYQNRLCHAKKKKKSVTFTLKSELKRLLLSILKKKIFIRPIIYFLFVSTIVLHFLLNNISPKNDRYDIFYKNILHFIVKRMRTTVNANITRSLKHSDACIIVIIIELNHSIAEYIFNKFK